ncbi:MAG: GGDEF domain-containing protein [Agarilytica sp.]
MNTFKIQFSSQEKESAYRAHYLQSDKNLARFIILVILVASILFISSDTLFTTSNSELLPLVIARLSFAVCSAVIIYCLRGVDSAKIFDLYCAMWLFSLILMMAFIYSTRPAANLNNTLTSCLMALLFYVLFPVRLSVQIISALALSLANIIHVFISKDLLQTGTMGSVVGSYISCNLIGLFIAIRWHKSRRREFSTHRKAMNLHKKLEELAFTDDLTGLANRRSSLKQLVSEYHRHKRYDNNLSIMVIDIDFFKHINDNYGHDQGDTTLKAIADLINNSCRNNDTAGRMGGEEFMVLLPETHLGDAHRLAERLREKCAALTIHSGDNEINVTISIGVSQANAGDEYPKDILKRADIALYNAKDRGRNCVVDA